MKNVCAGIGLVLLFIILSPVIMLLGWGAAMCVIWINVIEKKLKDKTPASKYMAELLKTKDIYYKDELYEFNYCITSLGFNNEEFYTIGLRDKNGFTRDVELKELIIKEKQEV